MFTRFPIGDPDAGSPWTPLGEVLLQRLQVAGLIWSRKPSSLILTTNGHLSELGESVGGGYRKYSREVVFPICVFILKVFSYPLYVCYHWSTPKSCISWSPSASTEPFLPLHPPCSGWFCF